MKRGQKKGNVLPTKSSGKASKVNGSVKASSTSHRMFSDLPKEVIQHIFNYQPFVEIRISESFAIMTGGCCFKFMDRSKKLFASCYRNYSMMDVLVFRQVFGKCKYYQYTSTMFDLDYPLTLRLVMIYPNIKFCSVELENCVDNFYFQYFFNRRVMTDMFLTVALSKVHILNFSNGCRNKKFRGGSTLNTLRFIRESVMKNFLQPCGVEQLISIEMRDIIVREHQLDALQCLWEVFTPHEVVVHETLKEGYMSRFETIQHQDGEIEKLKIEPVKPDEHNTVNISTLGQYLEYLQSAVISIMLNENQEQQQLFNSQNPSLDTSSIYQKLPTINHTVNFLLFQTMDCNDTARAFRQCVTSLGYYEKQVTTNQYYQFQRRERAFHLFTFFPQLTKLTFIVDNSSETLDDVVRLFKRYLPNLTDIDIRGGVHTAISIRTLLRDFPYLERVSLHLSVRAYLKPKTDAKGSGHMQTPTLAVGVPYLNETRCVKEIRVAPVPSASPLMISFDKETFLKQVVNTKLTSLKGDFLLTMGTEKLLPQTCLKKLALTQPTYNIFGKLELYKIFVQMTGLRVLYIHESMLDWRPKGYRPSPIDTYEKLMAEYKENAPAWEQKFKIYCKKEKSPLKKLLAEHKTLSKVTIFYRTMQKSSPDNHTIEEFEKKLAQLYESYVMQKHKNLKFRLISVME